MHAPHKHGLCLSVCLSHTGIASKRPNTSSNFSTIGYSHTTRFFLNERYGNIPTENRGVECRSMKKVAIFDQSRFISEMIKDRVIVTMERQ